MWSKPLPASDASAIVARVSETSVAQMQAVFRMTRYPAKLLLLLLVACSSPGWAGEPPTFHAQFSLEVVAGAERGLGTLTIKQTGQAIKNMRFNMPAARYRLLEADGISRNEGGIVYWEPPLGEGSLRYEVVLKQPRGKGYDGLVTPDWAIFRGDDVFPPARVVFEDDVSSSSGLTLDLPDGWKGVTPYAHDDVGGWQVHSPGRKFQRPTGWIMAGKLGIKRDNIADIRLMVAAPTGARAQRVSMLALLRWNLPWMSSHTPVSPQRLLIVSGPDPLWRGGLSALNSLYVHADLPLISEDGSSPLLHEIAHVLFPVNAASNEDWIDEGLPEYLSLRALKETGSLSSARYNSAISHFRERGRRVSSLYGSTSRGDVTARAVALFHDLNIELEDASGGKKDMLDLTLLMMEYSEALTLDTIRRLATDLLGAEPQSLKGELAGPSAGH